MTDRPMHTVPGLFERLTAIYADGERATEAGRLHDAVALFSEGIQLDDQFRNNHVTMYAQRAGHTLATICWNRGWLRNRAKSLLSRK